MTIDEEIEKEKKYIKDYRENEIKNMKKYNPEQINQKYHVSYYPEFNSAREKGIILFSPSGLLKKVVDDTFQK